VRPPGDSWRAALGAPQKSPTRANLVPAEKEAASSPLYSAGGRPSSFGRHRRRATRRTRSSISIALPTERRRAECADWGSPHAALSPPGVDDRYEAEMRERLQAQSCIVKMPGATCPRVTSAGDPSFVMRAPICARPFLIALRLALASSKPIRGTAICLHGYAALHRHRSRMSPRVASAQLGIVEMG
jgi:hypothetical protein